MATRLPPPPFLYAVVDAATLGDRRVGPAVRALAEGGARLLQIRAKGLSDRRFLELAREALAAARAAGVLLVVNDRPDIARILGADGVHVGQDDVPTTVARRLLGADAIVGVSTHNLEQLRAAAREPVDYVAVGPVYPTRSKARPDPVVGLELIREARSVVGGPLVAIGGITRQNAAAVVAAGADGVAVVSDLLRDADLGAAARGFLAALGGGVPR